MHVPIHMHGKLKFVQTQDLCLLRTKLKAIRICVYSGTAFDNVGVIAQVYMELFMAYLASIGCV